MKLTPAISISYLAFTVCLIFSSNVHSFVVTTAVFLFTEAGYFAHIAEHIISFLDVGSLRNAEQVCKQWQNLITTGKFWEFQAKLHVSVIHHQFYYSFSNCLIVNYTFLV